MATPDDEAFLKKYGNYNPTSTSVPVSAIKPILSGETPEQAAARRAKEEREARAAAIAEEAAARAAREEGRGIEEKTQGRIDKYRVEFLGMPEVKDFRNVLNATQQITALAQGEGSAMGDLASIFSYMKTLDPGSTVREGEAASAQNAAGIPERIRNAYNNLLSGERLSPEQRADMANTAITLYKSRANNYNSLANTYRGLLSKAGANPDEQGVTLAPSLEFKPAARETGGGQDGPTVSVTPEESIQAFGEFTGGKPGYDAQGNIVGYRYAEAGNQVYDERGNPINVGVFGRVTDETIQEPAPSFITGLIRGGIESVTGSERATATTEALPDWTQMPEFNNLLSSGTWKTAFGTAFGGGPQEIAQIVQSNFPETKVFQDEKGNYILQSPSTGQRYAIKPGFQVSDIPRALNIILTGAGTQGGVRGAMAVGAREAGLQTGIEALQAGTGGTFNPEDIAMAGVGGGVIQKAGEVLPYAAGRVVGTMRRGTAPTPVMPQGVPELPGGIPLPGGRVSAGPAAAVPEAAPVAPMAAPATGGMAAPEPSVAPSVGGMGGLSSAPTVGARPLQFNVAPADILERSTTRAKPGPGVLDDASISDRERVLDALGLPSENRRLGAITGNKSQIEDEVMVSKLGEGSERMQQQFDLESRHLGEYALDLVDRTGGTLNLPPVQRGVAIVKPLEDYQNWYNGRIRELYRQADAAAAEAGVPITLQGLDDALKVNSTFGGKAALTTLRKGVRQKLQEMGAIGPKGELLPIDTRTAETIRQYLNDQWSPEVSRVVGMLKSKIDDDVLSALPTDVYADARQMRRNYANIFEEPKGIAQLLDISGPEGVNRRIALDVVSDKLANLAQKDSAQFNAIVRTLENMPTPELQRVGNQAVAEIRAGILESILKKNVDFEDVARGGDAMWAKSDQSLSAGLIPFNGKLENIFGPDLAQRLETLRVGARILRFVDPNPSGTATASPRLVGKTREALIRSGSAMIGGGIGSVAGPTGAMIGGAAGERAGARLVQTAENRARQAAIARSLDPKEKAAQLAKMRKRQQTAGQ